MKNISLWCYGLGAVTASSILISAGLLQETTEAAFQPTPAMVKYMTPGPGHKKLDPLAGNWDLTLKWRMTPDAPWEESKAQSVCMWTLGGRFLEENVESEWMGEPFKGRWIMGYDTLRDEYTSVWFDNMGTGMMVGTGPAVEGNTITVEGTHTDAMNNDTKAWFRSVIIVRDADQHVWEFYRKSANGTEYQDMVITYKRR